ncbi:hypothetical protein B0H15DRAFT_761095, partial [Mycena belliarum]
SFKLDLPSELKSRGIHPAFHSSLLRIHHPNDDRRFPGRQIPQITGFGEHTDEWEVDRVLSHAGKGSDSVFEIKWKSGDTAWFPYSEVSHLTMMAGYLEAYGAQTISGL